MVINGLCNKRSGPGGSTRRLHQLFVFMAHLARKGLLWGRYRIDTRVKTRFLPGMVPPLAGRFTSANDNDLALAA